MSHVDTTQQFTHIELCAGYAGIHLGLARVIPNLRTIAYSEIEAFACANLVAKMEAGFLGPAPIWTNLKTFPWRSFRGCVDLLSGGYPCQPFSAAGQRAGKEDPRHLWPHIADGIAILQPSFCFFENVEGHITLGLSTVLSDLESLGYRCETGLFSAEECGAPHRRKRIFILANRISTGLEGWKGISGHDVSQQSASQRSRDLWPSRPEEPQYEWEPPRTVANAKRSERGQIASGRDERDGSDDEGQKTGGTCEYRRGEVLGNAMRDDQRRQPEPAMHWEGEPLGGSGCDVANGDHIRKPQPEGCEREQRERAINGGETMVDATGRDGLGQASREGHSAFCDQDMANADDRQRRVDGDARESEERAAASRGSEGVADSIGPDEAGRSSGCAETCKGWPHDQSGGSGCVQWQALSPLDGDAPGRTVELDETEWTAHDSRADELRLLGNGCVPATVELAFRTLLAKLA